MNVPFTLLLVALAVVLAMLAFVISGDPYISRKHRRVLLLAVLPRKLVSMYGYAMRPVLLTVLCCILKDRKKLLWSWILAGINGAAYMTALFSSVVFSISSNNKFYRGPLGYTCHVITAILLVNFTGLVFREYARGKKREALIPIMTVLIIIAAVLVDATVLTVNYPVTALGTALVWSCVFFYIWLHLRFVREHEEMLQAEQQIRIMMSQIRPHFLYNTLTAIQALCRTDPEKAFDVTERFGTYLRQNMDSLNQPEKIPLEQELEHTKLYAEIEQIRFPKIRIEYDIQDGGYLLPPLTIQPMVENAIRHGVRIREEGLVTVTARQTPQWHEIVIADNGRGFDIAAAEERAETAGGEAHIGIRNVRERTERICGGSVTVESRPMAGSTVTIRIPVQPEKQEAEGGKA